MVHVGAQHAMATFVLEIAPRPKTIAIKVEMQRMRWQLIKAIIKYASLWCSFIGI